MRFVLRPCLFGSWPELRLLRRMHLPCHHRSSLEKRQTRMAAACQPSCWCCVFKSDKPTLKNVLSSCICSNPSLTQGIWNKDVVYCCKSVILFGSTDIHWAHCSLHQDCTQQLSRLNERNLNRSTSYALCNFSALHPTYALYQRPLEVHEHCLPANVGACTTPQSSYKIITYSSASTLSSRYSSKVEIYAKNFERLKELYWKSQPKTTI